MSEREWMTPKEAAEYIRVSLGYLERRRKNGLPPTAVKIGKSIRYRRRELDGFLEGAG